MEWDPDGGKKSVQIVMKFLFLKSWIFLLNGSWSLEILYGGLRRNTFLIVILKK
jgi:hypothetical protein